MLDRVHIMWYFISCDEGRHPLMCRHLNPFLHGRFTCRPPGPNSGMLFGQLQSDGNSHFCILTKNRQPKDSDVTDVAALNFIPASEKKRVFSLIRYWAF